MKRGILYFIIFISIVFVLLVCFKYENINYKKYEEPIIKEEIVPEPKELSLLMVGDVLIHRSVYNDALKKDGTYDFTKMFTDIKDVVSQHDLAFYNQESIIGGKKLGYSAYPRFNSPKEIGDAMVDMGFNLVSLSNNHTMDKGTKAITHSLNYWKTKDVLTAGSYLSQEERNAVVIREKNGIKYALLAYTTVTNGLKNQSGKEYMWNIYDEETVKKDVEKLKNQVDVLMVSMHWGVEYTNTPNESQRKIAKYLASLGVDIVIGHHPHVIQPIEYIDNTLVLYSLGNFISAQDTKDRLTGAMVSVKITIDEENNINYSDLNAQLVYTYYNKSWRNFKIYKYQNLNTELLSNYKTMYTKYNNILTSLDKSVSVVSLE